jgi:hypothetical protein
VVENPFGHFIAATSDAYHGDQALGIFRANGGGQSFDSGGDVFSG